MNKIKVFFRDQESGDIGHDFIGEFTPDQIGNMVALVKEFGVFISDYSTYTSAQFMKANEEFIFEIIVNAK